MVHEEVVSTDKDAKLVPCRVENFTGVHQEWKLVSNCALDIVSQLFREPAVLFKDKVNFKAAGGGGFRAHQDITAFSPEKYANRHISVLVAVDNVDTLDMGMSAHEGEVPLKF